MLLVKSVSQFTHTYEVPDALTGDFLRWLNNNEDQVEKYEVDQQFVNEFIVYAGRQPDPGPGEEQRQTIVPPSGGRSIASVSK